MTLPSPRYLFRRYEILRRIDRGKNFLEIGAGNLELMKDVVDKFSKGTVVDFNTEIVSIYNNLDKDTRDSIEVVTDDFFKYKFKGKYDCIIACEVMEHVKDDERFLHRVWKLLNKDGKIILSVPARQIFWSFHDGMAGHYRRYEKKDIHYLLKKTGFVNVEVVSYGFPFVNVLRYIRLLGALKERKEREGLDMQGKTEISGIKKYSKDTWNIFKIVVNKYTFLPMNLVSSIFNRFDFSNGYIITAKK